MQAPPVQRGAPHGVDADRTRGRLVPARQAARGTQPCAAEGPASHQVAWGSRSVLLREVDVGRELSSEVSPVVELLVVLNAFIAASMPSRSHVSIAAKVCSTASAIAGSSSAENRCRT